MDEIKQYKSNNLFSLCMYLPCYVSGLLLVVLGDWRGHYYLDSRKRSCQTWRWKCHGIVVQKSRKISFQVLVRTCHRHFLLQLACVA